MTEVEAGAAVRGPSVKGAIPTTCTEGKFIGPGTTRGNEMATESAETLLILHTSGLYPGKNWRDSARFLLVLLALDRWKRPPSPSKTAVRGFESLHSCHRTSWESRGFLFG